jgi:hypothetical protein
MNQSADMSVDYTWQEANQRYLTTALRIVLEALECHAARSESAGESIRKAKMSTCAQDALAKIATKMSAPPALEALGAIFCLSPFERDTLLLCAGMELDSKFRPLCAAAQGEPNRPWPTWSLALAALPNPHWSAITAAGPLRRWRLIEIGPGDLLTTSSLRIDERVLHYLTGISYLDDRLISIIEPVCATADLVPSHRLVTEHIIAKWLQTTNKSSLPVVQLWGDEFATMQSIAAAACADLGLKLHAISASTLPTAPAELEATWRLWERESALLSSALLLAFEESEPSNVAFENTIRRVIESARMPLIVTARTRWPIRRRPIISFEVRKPSCAEQRATWEGMLGDASTELNGQLDRLVSQFNLNVPTIRFVCANAKANDQLPHLTCGLPIRLWDACRIQARPQLRELGQCIEPTATWEDLVLPTLQLEVLHDIAVQVRNRAKVYETWGVARKSARGLGISALFFGPSGTGKTITAEVLANELRLDLFRIDLSAVVSKYIGETEKNLRRVFDAAEEGGAVLAFDEADALFGKRSEVKDSHDRYANIEISYLLQRMETYRGLAILTTNMKNALDTAFLRRIRFFVQFPFPDAAQRAEIWRRIFPKETPTADLDIVQLARLNVPGGNIRNIAVNGSFLAAESGEPVRMVHLLRAARAEYSKMEKSMTEAEVGGWK